MENLKLRVNISSTRNFLYLIILILSSENLIGQVTFSKRESEYLKSVYTNVMITGYGYLMAGISQDTVGGFHQSVTTIGFDFFGEKIFDREFYSTDWQMNLKARNARLNDSTFVLIGENQVSGNDTSYAVVIWLDTFGDTIYTRNYKSPYFDGPSPSGINWNKPTCIEVSDDGQFIYYAAQIVHSAPTQNNFLIRKLTNQGDVVWTYISPLSDEYYVCSTIKFRNGSIWFQKVGTYNRLCSLDDDTGNLIESIELNGSTFPLFRADEMVMDNEGVVTACVQFNSDYDPLPGIYKMDYSGNYLWYNIPENGSNLQNQDNEHVVQSSDNGFVSCSTKFQQMIFPPDPSIVNNNFTIWLWKVNEFGELQWERNYEYYSFDSGYFQLTNKAYDFKATPDGGYICAGEATALCLDYPQCDEFTQQGWLLKLDGCGCLVPGCDENCSTDLSETENVRSNFFKVGPNPASDEFHVFLSSQAEHKNGLMLECINSDGQLVHSMPLKHDNTTYIIDVHSLAAGSYLLRLKDNSEVLQTERVMIVR